MAKRRGFKKRRRLPLPAGTRRRSLTRVPRATRTIHVETPPVSEFTEPKLSRAERRRQAVEQYRRDLRLLRENYEGFGVRSGYTLQAPQRRKYRSKRAYRRALGLYGARRKQIMRLAPQIAGLREAQGIPHVSRALRGMSARMRKATQAFVPELLAGHKPRAVNIVTDDPNAKLRLGVKGELVVDEYGRQREVWEFDNSKLFTDRSAFYKSVRDFMTVHRAKYVTLNIGKNMIAQVFDVKDFEEGLLTARFVQMVERYITSTKKRAFTDFASNLNGISIYRGGERVAQASAEGIRAARKAHRLSKRERLTGRS